MDNQKGIRIRQILQSPTKYKPDRFNNTFKRRDYGRAKARIVGWGHRDGTNYEFRTDYPCLKLEIFRLFMSIDDERHWSIDRMNISAAFFQERGFYRETFVKPAKDESKRIVL